MSDPAVVAIIRARLETLSTPFVQTLNARPTSLPNVYTSIDRDYCEVSRVTLGSPAMFREIGSISPVAHVRSGTGYDSLDTLAIEIRDLFHNYDLLHFRVTTVGSPITFEPDEGNFLQMRIPVFYQFDFFK